MKKILIVEDTQSLRDVLCTVLEYAGYSVARAESAELGFELIRQRPFDLVLSDYRLPKESGLDLLRKVRELRPELPFIIMTAYGTMELTVDALRLGASDFIVKPFEPEALISTVAQVLTHERVINRPRAPVGAAKGEAQRSRAASAPHPLIAESPAMKDLLSLAERVAPFDSSVFITGESGTGKELLARFIHNRSGRQHGPLVAINCGAIPEALLESELFGHEAGAFTGATRQRIGLIEAASSGTLLLDELGELIPVLQVKLLRAIQDGVIRRVGGTDDIAAAPRYIASTNRNPDEAIAARELRADLYYRLAVVPLHIPPLRERREDLEPLVNYFLEFHANRLGRSAPALAPESWDTIRRFPWPGNVRELEHRLERAVILASDVIHPEHLGISALALDWKALDGAQKHLSEIAQQATETAEQQAIRAALQAARGDKMRAALALGVSYKTLLKKIKQLKISSAAEKGTAGTRAAD